MFGIKRRRRLARENAALRDALGWYASSSNWRRKGVHAKGEPVQWVKAPTSFDRGARAKFVLSQLDASTHTHRAVAIPAPVDTSDTE